MLYEDQVREEVSLWAKKLFKQPGMLEQASKKLGMKVNSLIPQKAHDAITAAVRTIVKTTLFGAEYTPKRKVTFTTLEEADRQAKDAISLYRKIAAAEGAGTGAGGILMNVVDFPALIAIKMKFLFELSHIYGYSTTPFSERIFILSVFQLAYSGPTERQRMFQRIRNWETEKQQWSSDVNYHKNMDWETFQKEYRDAIDFRKMLQMIPGIGAVAGAWANYNILEELGETAMNSYRLRRLAEATQRRPVE
ncbi:ecsC [Paenibacillus swuensis]|uniref:EcsC n=1 Tax=Paenibacillus swuensis TaxID=1178515 RepID=A0A172TFI5_9BACL|nr:EcsC family protein [Paenibacillus swuensis]ANE45770.1 ecsC [Paenibacillus swuensis]